jgi:hypothetical protein
MHFAMETDTKKTKRMHRQWTENETVLLVQILEKTKQLETKRIPMEIMKQILLLYQQYALLLSLKSQGICPDLTLYQMRRKIYQLKKFHNPYVKPRLEWSDVSVVSIFSK